MNIWRITLYIMLRYFSQNNKKYTNCINNLNLSATNTTASSSIIYSIMHIYAQSICSALNLLKQNSLKIAIAWNATTGSFDNGKYSIPLSLQVEACETIPLAWRIYFTLQNHTPIWKYVHQNDTTPHSPFKNQLTFTITVCTAVYRDRCLALVDPVYFRSTLTLLQEAISTNLKLCIY